MDLEGKNTAQLGNAIRSLEYTCNAQDAAAQVASRNLMRLEIDNRDMLKTLKLIQESDCGGHKGMTTCGSWIDTPGGLECIHVAAKKAIEKGEKSHDLISRDSD